MTTTRFASAVIVGIAVLAVVVFAGLISASATSGTLTILVDTVLTEDHNGNIVIGADNVMLDCAGYTVMGTGTDPSDGTGVLVQDRTNVTVKDCHVTNFSGGFAVGGSTAIDLTGNSANSNNGGFGVGDSSTDVTLDGNTASNNIASGFGLFSVSGNTLVDNEASGNTLGFALGDASNNVVRSNRAVGNDGTQFDFASSHLNIIEGNVAEGGAHGFHISGSDGNTISRNTLVGMISGAFVLQTASDNTLTENVAANTGGGGFNTNESSHGNSFNLNMAEGNGGYGFSTSLGATGNTYTDNSSHRNGTFGFHDSTTDSGTAGTGNTYSDNICLRNTNGGSNPVGLCNESGTFSDDDGNIFEFSIEWLADEGITQGCNPPANTMFCPDDFVTRGEMAVFLVRALDYTDNGGGNLFTDDDGLFYENSADRLKTAKVTLGCNPPTNNKYCGESHVTRGQMAAFLVRAMGYTDNGGGDLFTDDDGHIFENAIDKLGTAGVTQGCNPPTNDKFCPDDKVTRGQMAAFLKRALG